MYTLLPEKYKSEKMEYANFDQVKVKLPCNMVVCGGTGSGKTNAVLNFIMDTNAFSRFYIFAKNLDEPIYQYLIDSLRKIEQKTKAQILIVSNSLADLPPLTSLDKKENNLFICDDMVTEKSKDLAKVSQYYIACRKYNCCSLFLTQEYYGTPTIIRNNSRVVIITKIERARNLQFIMKEFSLDVDDKQAKRAYDIATAGGFPNFLLIDPDNQDPDLRFRRNFVGIPMSKITGRGSTEEAEFLDEDEDHPKKKARRYPRPVLS